MLLFVFVSAGRKKVRVDVVAEIPALIDIRKIIFNLSNVKRLSRPFLYNSASSGENTFCLWKSISLLRLRISSSLV